MIQVDNLTKYFGPVLAVDDISFRVERGDIVGFLGPNGAGKTTTIRILTSFLPATSGIARVGGHDVMMESMDVRRHIGYLPESVPIYPEMRVDEYLLYRAKLKEVERKRRQQRIDYCLDAAVFAKFAGGLSAHFPRAIANGWDWPTLWFTIRRS